MSSSFPQPSCPGNAPGGPDLGPVPSSVYDIRPVGGHGRVAGPESMPNSPGSPQRTAHVKTRRLAFVPPARENPHRGTGPLPDVNLNIEDLTTQQLNACMAGALAVGTLYCFLGYRTLRLVLALTGFLLAGAVAGALALWLTDGNDLIAVVALGIGGICGAFALFFIYRAGIFLVGLLGAGLVANNLLHAANEPWEPFAVIGIALAGGLVAMIMEMPVMMAATAALGAWMMVMGGTYFAVGADDFKTVMQAVQADERRLTIITSWIALTVAGLLSQISTRQRGTPKTKEG